MMKRLLASVLIAMGAATPLLAQEPAPPLPRCEPSSLSAQEATYEGYDYTMTGEGFAYYERRHIDGDRWEFIIDHCPSRNRLTVALNGVGVAGNVQHINDVSGVVLDAIQGERAYTLRDLARLDYPHGARGAVTTAPTQGCVCTDMGY
jgi:hypothetical protein